MPIQQRLSGLWGRNYHTEQALLAQRIQQGELQQQAFVAKTRQDLAIGELQRQNMEFRNNVVNPLEVRQAQIEIERQQGDAVVAGMRNEIEAQKLKNRSESYAHANQLHSSFLQLDPEERYSKRHEFTDQARRLYELNPNENTEAVFKQFAQYDISRELSGELPPVKKPEGFGETFAESGTPEGDYLKTTFEGTSSEPTTEPEPSQPAFRDNIERLQNLRNKYINYPDLIAPIEAKLEQEMNRPQYWAGQFDTMYSELPDSAKGILDKAKTGRVVSPLERKMVELSMEQTFKSGLQNGPGYKGPQPSTELLTNFDSFSPTQKARIKQAYPHINWEGRGATTPTGPAPTMEGIQKIATQDQTGQPPQIIAKREPTPEQKPTPEQTTTHESTQEIDHLPATILEEFRSNPDLNTSFGEYLKSGAWAQFISYNELKEIEDNAHKETAIKISVERNIANRAVMARDRYFENRSPENLARWEGLKRYLREVRGLSTEKPPKQPFTSGTDFINNVLRGK